MNTVLVGCGIALYSTILETVRRFVLPFLGPLGRKKGWNLDERQKMPRIVRKHQSRTMVWVHGASLGEAKLLLQFLEVLEQRNPDDAYVVTATTRTGVEYVERMKRPSIYAIGFLPFDTLPLMKSLIRSFGVSRLWLLETELWPAMLWACIACGVPVGIANARIEEKSFVNYRRFTPVVRGLLRGLDVVLAQNETYARRFMELGVGPSSIHIVGNLKGRIQIRRPSSDERRNVRRLMCLTEADKVVTAGCLHKGEGALLRGCLDILIRRNRRCKCIVVPRHLDESASIARELGNSVVRLTDSASSVPWDLCIVEKMGILESMYKIADAAVVGGTFVDIGGHNMWEPARFGIPVFFGPFHQSQNTSCEKLLAAGVGFKVSEPQELANAIERAVWTEPEKFAAVQSVFAENVNQQQTILEPLIP
jgi:3-deoxy-D-manno-octulosonic-acid transferase